MRSHWFIFQTKKRMPFNGKLLSGADKKKDRPKDKNT